MKYAADYPESIKEGKGNFSKPFLSKNIIFAKNLFAVAVICGSSVLCESSAECEKGSDDSGRMGLLTTIHNKPHLSNRICSEDQYYSFSLV